MQWPGTVLTFFLFLNFKLARRLRSLAKATGSWGGGLRGSGIVAVGGGGLRWRRQLLQLTRAPDCAHRTACAAGLSAPLALVEPHLAGMGPRCCGHWLAGHKLPAADGLTGAHPRKAGQWPRLRRAAWSVRPFAAEERP